jgi:peptidoglycan/xylan/chitin deacetylase (PgdA/CDA1 family)
MKETSVPALVCLAVACVGEGSESPGAGSTAAELVPTELSSPALRDPARPPPSAVVSAPAAVAPPTKPRFVEGHATCPVPEGFDAWSWKRIHRVEGLREKAVVLTLDVGARIENLLAVLDLLRERDVKTTIFLYTGELERHPRRDAVLLRMVEDGHELANHTLSHKDLTTMLDAEVREQLDRVERLVDDSTGVSVRPFFREPFLATNAEVDRVVREACYRSVWFTVDTSDWREGMTPSKIEDAVFLHRGRPREIEPGSIFIFHGSQRANLIALPRILDRLRSEGWSFLRLGEALQRAKSGATKGPRL